MKIPTSILLSCALAASALVHAQPAPPATPAKPAAPAAAPRPTEASVERVIELSGAQRVLTTMQEQIDRYMQMGMAQAFKSQNQSPEAKKTADSVRQKIAEEVKSETSWEKMKDLYLKAFSDKYTQEEIDGLIKFYESPAGKAFVAKMPVVMSNLMLQMQQRLGPVVQKMQLSIQEAAKQVNPAKDKPPLATPPAPAKP